MAKKPRAPRAQAKETQTEQPAPVADPREVLAEPVAAVEEKRNAALLLNPSPLPFTSIAPAQESDHPQIALLDQAAKAFLRLNEEVEDAADKDPEDGNGKAS